MADPLCRWRNVTSRTICEIVETLPKTEMSDADFRKSMKESKWGDAFMTTIYQVACQTALYYVDKNNIYHPRFIHNISEDDAEKYLSNWFKKYYIPNPYTRGFISLTKPLVVVKSFEESLRRDPAKNNFNELCKALLKDDVGNLDIFKNAMNKYSGSLSIDKNDIISFVSKGEREMEIDVDRNDKKAFFENFDEKLSSNSYVSNFDQIIYYGVPGSGKSHTIDEMVKGVSDDQKMRVVFHPEYSNADFVGQILPKLEDGIDYRFKAGPFSRILKKALKNPDKRYYLIIEEINRGNAAAIFGELFQLLDRDKDGWSQYIIDNIDINAFIRSKDDTYTDKNSEISPEVEFGGLKFNANSGIKLPPNLSILATMNTSDQNVFTLDNAFQRRWKMILVENKFNNTPEELVQKDAIIADGKLTWGKFQEYINELIGKKTSSIGMSSMEDKRLGCWFVKAEDGKISKDIFAEKVLKYLWDDAFKFCREEVFNIENKNTTLESVISQFKEGSGDSCWNIFKDTPFVDATTE